LKNPKKSSNKSWVFQGSWATKFPWAKTIIGEDSLVSQGDKKLSSPKLNTLQRHIGWNTLKGKRFLLTNQIAITLHFQLFYNSNIF
jgi:hypothetical protein